MYESRKKAREEFWLLRFQQESGIKLEIDDDRDLKERPDFLVRFQGRLLGVEVAELQIDRDRGPVAGSALQMEASLQGAVLSRAKQLYFERASRPLNARVAFRAGLSQSLKKAVRRHVAQQLAGALLELELEPFERQRLDAYTDPPVPAPISFVHTLGLPGEAIPRWQVISSGWSRPFQASDVAPLLAEKNRLIAAYREAVQENWLLLVADGSRPPGMFQAPDQGSVDLPSSEFDRTFLLCEPSRFFMEWPPA